MRLVGTSMDCYNYLEPLYNDYRKIRRKNKMGSKLDNSLTALQITDLCACVSVTCIYWFPNFQPYRIVVSSTALINFRMEKKQKICILYIY